ncbi:hypothetical protein FHL15_010317 [Xylaria flabelliformis]|uniref:Uncharacterized protein n=1 Tax=Xylaria flabelliformis TaxID=2512241 RepID=A0A553HLF8_9PEZI|nr:hypothetical protein FHL15_010317 [Xylaria flabelliformis]
MRVGEERKRRESAYHDSPVTVHAMSVRPVILDIRIPRLDNSNLGLLDRAGDEADPDPYFKPPVSHVIQQQSTILAVQCLANPHSTRVMKKKAFLSSRPACLVTVRHGTLNKYAAEENGEFRGPKSLVGRETHCGVHYGCPLARDVV